MAINSFNRSSDLTELENDISISGRGERAGKGKGRGGKSSGGRGGQGRAVDISKALSKLLRHDAEKEGLALDPEGFARVDEVLKWRRLQSLHVTFSDIQTAVADNAKQRFSLKPNPEVEPIPDAQDTEPSNWLIRANQGHSIAIESASLLKPITLEADNVPDMVVHGTYYAFYPAILQSGGLKKMGRNHVHFSTGLPEDRAGVISGMRSDAELLIYVDVRKSLEDGAMLWWLSDNGVVLTEGDGNGLVPTKYWRKAEGRRLDAGLLWQDGKEIAELPQSLRGRNAPRGKGLRARANTGGKTERRAMKELVSLGGEAGLGMGKET